MSTAHEYMEALTPWLWAIKDVDEAERRGDAASALEVMKRRALDPEGRPFWRPSRTAALEQLVRLAADLPAWAISRWILLQARQYLHEKDRGPRSRTSRAVEAAVDLRGGLAAIAGRDEPDQRARVIDHDWVFHQLYLYDLGGLDAFLRGVATPDLVAGADRIAEWAGARMGGYHYLGAGGDTLLWHDHGTHTVVTTLNIGSAARLVPGAHVIGRRVPVERGALFESPPLEVPRALACATAADPSGWLETLRGAADQVRDGAILTHHPEWRSLLSDVPIEQLRLLLGYRVGLERLDLDAPGPDLARAALDLARCELEQEYLREMPHRLGQDDDEWDGWAHVHAALLDPIVVQGLPDVVGPTDLDLLREVGDRVAEPARALVDRLIRSVGEAA